MNASSSGDGRCVTCGGYVTTAGCRCWPSLSPLYPMKWPDAEDNGAEFLQTGRRQAEENELSRIADALERIAAAMESKE